MKKRYLVIGGFLLTALLVLVNPWVISRWGSAALLADPKVMATVVTLDALTLLVLVLVLTALVKSWNRKTLVFSLISLVLVLGAVEGGLRLVQALVHPGPGQVVDRRILCAPFRDQAWAEEYWREYNNSGNEYRPFILWDRKKFSGRWINVNDNGVRRTWNPVFPVGVNPRIVYVFGGSTVWGTGARDDYTIPSQLSRLLNESQPGYRVTNYGETAYTFPQELVQLVLLLRDGARPNYVVFYDGFNDVYAAYQSGRVRDHQNYDITARRMEGREEKKTMVDRISREVSRFMIVRTLSHLVGQGLGGGQGGDNLFGEIAAKYPEAKLETLAGAVVRNYEKSMDLLEHLSRAYGFEYLCLWQPCLFTESRVLPDEEGCDERAKDRALASLYRQAHQDLGRITDAHFHDITDALKGRTVPVYMDACHISEEGNRLVAERILDLIRKETGSGD